MQIPTIIPFLLVVGVMLWLAWTVGTWTFEKIFGKVEHDAQLRLLRTHDIQDGIVSDTEFFVHNQECVCGEGYIILVGIKDVVKFNDSYSNKLRKSAHYG